LQLRIQHCLHDIVLYFSHAVILMHVDFSPFAL
jgi:hypothetical protein